MTVTPDDGDRQAGLQRDLARDVGAGGAFGVGAAHEHVLDRAGVDAGALRRRACTAWPPSVAPWVMLKAPFQLLARGVRAVETMTALVMAMAFLGRSES